MRSRAEPWGLDSLTPDQARQVSGANALVNFCVQVVRNCRRLGIPFGLEIPKTSLLWSLPPLNSEGPTDVLTSFDFCQYGTSWRKPTSVLSNHRALQAIGLCCSPKAGLSARTGRRHQLLEGETPEGVWWTTVAEPYPPRL